MFWVGEPSAEAYDDCYQMFLDEGDALDKIEPSIVWSCNIFEQGEAILVGNDVEIYVVTSFHFLFSHKD
ncbi:TPA: hypothetical protein ACOJPY_003498 [Vibrio harveyi]